jgi:hypothetical protein
MSARVPDTPRRRFGKEDDPSGAYGLCPVVGATIDARILCSSGVFSPKPVLEERRKKSFTNLDTKNSP